MHTTPRALSDDIGTPLPHLMMSSRTADLYSNRPTLGAGVALFQIQAAVRGSHPRHMPLGGVACQLPRASAIAQAVQRSGGR
ncbi:hypothetical protein MDS_4076 [Ectopseudomonas mendocina NK-01]|nr:hypothetical protein MDS_4076 [Pseudomonas mendocina NK-01]